MNDEIDSFYKREAKDLVDFLFDKRFLNDELSRDAVQWLEDYIAFLFQSKSETAVKCALLTAKMRERK